MIDYVFIRELIETFLEENFTTVPIQFENLTIDDVEEYISVEDTNDDSEQLGSGIEAYRVYGAITIKIYTPLNTGTERSKQLATELTTLLTKKEVSTFTFSVPILSSFGQVKDSSHYQQNLTIPYTYIYGQNENVC